MRNKVIALSLALIMIWAYMLGRIVFNPCEEDRLQAWHPDPMRGDFECGNLVFVRPYDTPYSEWFEKPRLTL